MVIQNLECAEWKFHRVGEKQWYPAVVPGSLFLDMMNNHLIKDPYYRFNERQFSRLAEDDYEYIALFHVREELLEKERLFLVFEGLDTITRIEINGELLANTDNMHRTYRFDVKNRLKKGENEIRITFYSPVRYIAEQHKAHPIPEMNTASPHGFSQIRKIHSSFGWDAEPCVPDSGIWRDVYLEAYDAEKIDHIYVRQKHSGKEAELSVEICLEKYHREESRVHIDLWNPDQLLEAEADLQITGEKGVWTIRLEDPRLWWPNGYGDQPLYRLDVILESTSASAEIDRKSQRIGLRKAEVRREKDQWGESFAFYVNDVPVFAKGGCYTPPDKFLALCRGERHRKLIQYCAEANYNCIRVWGGAVYPDDEFFDLCDEYGILVWQDLMFACALYHLTDEFIENICAETKDNVIRIRNHPSVILWCGNNENEWFHDFEHDLEGLNYKLRMDNLRQYEVYLASVVKKYDPDRLFWPSTPSSGGGYADPNGYEKGDVHCWYVWYLPAKPYTFYKECQARFVSEYGLESFQDIKTLRHYMEPGDMTPNSEVMDFMQKCSDNFCCMGNGKIMSYVFQEVRPPKNFEEYVFATQYAQAEGIKYGTGWFRKQKPRCMGSLYWQIVDCFPGTTWSGIDYEYRWKMLHYYAKRFFQKTMIWADGKDQKAEIYVIHDGQEEVSAEIRWSLKKNDGSCVLQGSRKAAIEKNSSSLICDIDMTEAVNEDNRNMLYLDMELVDEDEKLISSDTYLFVKPKHFQFLKPEIELSVSEEKERFVINLQTSVYTKCIRLDFTESDGVFSDNCFDLSPGQTKTVYVKKCDLSKDLSEDEFKNELYYQTLNAIGM